MLKFAMSMQKTFSPNRTVIFAFFANAILFAMVREWSSPVACLRSVFPGAATLTSR
jgi:hypothetical protein